MHAHASRQSHHPIHSPSLSRARSLARSRAKGNQLYVPQLDRIVLKDSSSRRPFGSSQQCRKTAVTTRILSLVHELCLKRIHVTKRDLFYTDVKLFEARALLRCGLG